MYACVEVATEHHFLVQNLLSLSFSATCFSGAVVYCNRLAIPLEVNGTIENVSFPLSGRTIREGSERQGVQREAFSCDLLVTTKRAGLEDIT